MSAWHRVASILTVLAAGAWASASESMAGRGADEPPLHRPTSAAAQVQDDRPVFRGGVELVQLDVSVLDRDRQPVVGLTASDFTVLENGVERPIRAFTPVTLPPGMAAPAAGSVEPVPADVATNAARGQDGRLVIILMDRTIPPGQPTLAARNVATAIVGALGPTDLAAVVSTSGGVPQNLTSDRKRLLAAIHQRDWSTGLSKEQEDTLVGKQDPLSDPRCLCGLCVLETVTRVAEAVRDAPRKRKVLFFVGSRLIVQAGPRAPSADIGCGRRVEDTRRAMADALALSHLTIHSIDPGGLAGLGAHTRAGSPGGRNMQAPAARLQALKEDTADMLNDHGSLRVLPDLTGGRAVMNLNAPETEVPRLFAESGSYYVMAFEPGRPGRDDAEHAIEVRVNRRGARVHTQRRYVLSAAAAAGPALDGGAPSLEQALRVLLPNASRPLALAVAAFAGAPPSEHALVLANVDVSRFADEWHSPHPLQVAISAVDRAGREIALGRQTSTVTLPAGLQTMPAEVNIQTQLEVPAGDYEIRVAVRDPASGTTASVFGDMTVAAFDTLPLSLSDLLVQTSAGRASGMAADPMLQPTTRRRFSPAEDVRALAQIYQGTSRTDALVHVPVRMRILDAAGRPVRDQVISLAAAGFVDRRASVALQIGELPPGEYTLMVDIESATTPPRSRSLTFAVAQ